MSNEGSNEVTQMHILLWVILLQTKVETLAEMNKHTRFGLSCKRYTVANARTSFHTCAFSAET